MDSSPIGKGSPDPVVFKKKCPDPAWGESWALPADTADGILEVVLEDYDALSGNDFIGKLLLPLSKLRGRAPLRRWFPLGDQAGRRAGGVRGDLDLQLRWVHNPALVQPELLLADGPALRPPKGEQALYKDKARNGLLVTVIQAKICS